jgi:CBS domain-containing protein/ribosome-associated translation inhibitor RaiA
LNEIELDKMLVRDVMSSAKVTSAKGESVSEVVSKMKKYQVREVPVLDGDKPIGLVSYASFIHRRGLPMAAKVEQVMLPVPRLEEDMPVTSAVEEMMSAGVRGAPVVRAGKMIGFLSRTDLIRIFPRLTQLKDKKVSSFMTSEPISVTEQENVRKAQMMMKGLMEKSLPVVDSNQRLVGAISMSEVMEVLWTNKSNMRPPNEVMGGREQTEISVGSVMTRPAISVSPGDTAGKVAEIMSSKGLATVFVTEENRLVGVVSQADLMEQILSLKPTEGVYVQITGLNEEDPEVYDVLYDIIGKSMKRIDKIQPPRVFTVHVSVYHSEGMRSKYSLVSRLTTTKKMYYARATEWDLYKTMDTMLDSMEKNVKREHEKHLDLRKVKQSL